MGLDSKARQAMTRELKALDTGFRASPQRSAGGQADRIGPIQLGWRPNDCPRQGRLVDKVILDRRGRVADLRVGF